MQINCGNCRFFTDADDTFADEKIGYCGRFPPRPYGQMIKTDKGEIFPDSVFPVVFAENGCGEYQPSIDAFTEQGKKTPPKPRYPVP